MIITKNAAVLEQAKLVPYDDILSGLMILTFLFTFHDPKVKMKTKSEKENVYEFYFYKSQHPQISGQTCGKREDSGDPPGSYAGTFCRKPAALGVLRGDQQREAAGAFQGPSLIRHGEKCARRHRSCLSEGLPPAGLCTD